MLVAIAIILTVLSAFLLLFRPYYGFLLLIVSKPIIDMSWAFRPGGYSLVQMISVIVPIFILPRLINSAYWKDPKNKIWVFFACILFLSQFISAVFNILQDTVTGFDAIFRSLNVLVGFLLIPAFATTSERLRQILLAFIIAGIAPLIISIYGDATGTVWRSRITVGLERNLGLYHNGVSIRHFGLQSILAGLMYIQLYRPEKLLYRLFVISFMFGSSYMLYKGYTRGGLTTLVLWFIIWVIAYRKIGWGVVLGGLLVAIEIVTQGAITNETFQLFNKEVTFYEGGFADNRKILNGRLGVWELHLQDWADQARINRLFGGNYLGFGTHNEILRVLLASGLFGVILYIVSMASITLWTIIHFFNKENARYGIFSILILGMYYVEATGATPGLFPQYQWFVFGFLGTFLLNSARLSGTEHLVKNRSNRNYSTNQSLARV